MSDESEKDPCPKCSGEMVLARITPGLGGYPELRTFQCLDCGHVMTNEVEE
jgi:hypothetical protein